MSDFEEIDSYENNFRNIEQLYQEKSKWNEFTDKTLKKMITLVNFPEVKKYLEQLSKKMLILNRELEVNEVVQALKHQIDSFKPGFYAVEACRNKILDEKHFEEMRKIVKRNVGDRPFVREPNEVEELFKDFSLPYYNFEYFGEL